MKKEKWLSELKTKYLKRYLDLKKYESYCLDCGLNPSDKQSKIQYGEMLLGIAKYEIEHYRGE